MKIKNCYNCANAVCEDPDGYGPKTIPSYYLIIECSKDCEAWIDDGDNCEEWEER